MHLPARDPIGVRIGVNPAVEIVFAGSSAAFRERQAGNQLRSECAIGTEPRTSAEVTSELRILLLAVSPQLTGSAIDLSRSNGITLFGGSGWRVNGPTFWRVPGRAPELVGATATIFRVASIPSSTGIWMSTSAMSGRSATGDRFGGQEAVFISSA